MACCAHPVKTSFGLGVSLKVVIPKPRAFTSGARNLARSISNDGYPWNESLSALSAF
jgi:hypothetical protein